VERALRGVPGVTNAQVNLAIGRGRVRGGEPARIVEAVRAAGYEARVAGELDLASVLAEDALAARRGRIEVGGAAVLAGAAAMLAHFAHGHDLAEGLLATGAVVVGGRPFLLGALQALRRATGNMDVLV